AHGNRQERHASPTRRSSDLAPFDRPAGDDGHDGLPEVEARLRRARVPGVMSVRPNVRPRAGARNSSARTVPIRSIGADRTSGGSDRKSTRLNSSHVKNSYAV